MGQATEPGLADALIAATAASLGATLMTLNLKYFLLLRCMYLIKNNFPAGLMKTGREK